MLDFMPLAPLKPAVVISGKQNSRIACTHFRITTSIPPFFTAGIFAQQIRSKVPDRNPGTTTSGIVRRTLAEDWQPTGEQHVTRRRRSTSCDREWAPATLHQAQFRTRAQSHPPAPTLHSWQSPKGRWPRWAPADPAPGGYPPPPAAPAPPAPGGRPRPPRWPHAAA